MFSEKNNYAWGREKRLKNAQHWKASEFSSFSSPQKYIIFLQNKEMPSEKQKYIYIWLGRVLALATQHLGQACSSISGRAISSNRSYILNNYTTNTIVLYLGSTIVSSPLTEKQNWKKEILIY